MSVTLIDSEYNRRKGVVGRLGDIQYQDQCLGTLILTKDGTWLYYFKGEEGFVWN